MTIHATLLDGRTIASGSSTYVLGAAGNYAVVVTLPELRTIEAVLEWRLSTDPLTDPGTPTNEVITNNVVGCTLMGVGAGTTLRVEVKALGF